MNSFDIYDIFWNDTDKIYFLFDGEEDFLFIRNYESEFVTFGKLMYSSYLEQMQPCHVHTKEGKGLKAEALRCQLLDSNNNIREHALPLANE